MFKQDCLMAGAQATYGVDESMKQYFDRKEWERHTLARQDVQELKKRSTPVAAQFMQKYILNRFQQRREYQPTFYQQNQPQIGYRDKLSAKDRSRITIRSSTPTLVDDKQLYNIPRATSKQRKITVDLTNDDLNDNRARSPPCDQIKKKKFVEKENEVEEEEQKESVTHKRLAATNSLNIMIGAAGQLKKNQNNQSQHLSVFQVKSYSQKKQILIDSEEEVENSKESN